MNLPIRKTLQTRLEELDLHFKTKQVEQTLTYLKLLCKWNEKYNLVADSDAESILTRHILDSLSVYNYADGRHILDVGSGAGFPGIPLAIFKPKQKFTLLDSNGKKARFLFQVKTDLSLINVGVENCRIERYQPVQRIDMVICRAFSGLAEFVSKAKHLVPQKCKLLAMKGRFPEEEINGLPEEFFVKEVVKLQAPGDDAERHLVTLVRN